MVRAVALRYNALILCMVILLSAVFPAPCWAEWRKGIPRRSNAPDAITVREAPRGGEPLPAIRAGVHEDFTGRIERRQHKWGSNSHGGEVFRRGRIRRRSSRSVLTSYRLSHTIPAPTSRGIECRPPVRLTGTWRSEDAASGMRMGRATAERA